MRQFFLGRKFFYAELGMMFVLGALCALFIGIGAFELFAGTGLDSLMDFAMACFTAYLGLVVWSDVKRQRRRFADPHFQGFPDLKK